MHRSAQGKHVAVRRRGVKLSRATVAAAVAGLVGSMGITAIAVAPAEATVVKPFTVGYDQDVYGDFLEVGNGSMRCPNPGDPTDPSSSTPIASCAPGQARGNTTVNDNYFMRWADVDADAATFSSSQAAVTIPAGADIAYARLNWAGNTGRIKTTGTSYSATRGCSTRQITNGTSSPVPAGSPATTPVRLSVGAAAAVPITGSTTVDPAAAVPNNSPEYYSSFADVTSAFAGAATGAPLTVGVGNVWAPEGFNCFGGWSLVLVYEYDGPNANAPLKRSVQIFDGHVRQANGEAPTGVTLNGIRAATADVRVGLTAYEGDFGIAGDQFQINGTSVVEPSPGGVASNFFVSDADGASSPSVANNFSVDAKQITTTLIPSGSQTASLNFVTSGDSYLAQNLVLSVPIPDLSMTKVPNATAARPGDSITFTITATNPTPVGLSSVQVSDPQYPQCDRSIGDLAGNSSFQYTCTTVAGADDLTNTATGSGTDTFGDTITDTVTAPTVDVIYPAVDLTKSLDPATPGPFAPGDTVTFDLQVENTGDSTLTDVVVTDPAVPACARTFTSLASGAIETWTCSTTAPVAGRTNTARVNATDASGQNVNDVDDATAPNAASINGRVFVDADGDGAFGASDSGFGGVTLDLTGTDENGDPVSRTTTTTNGGLWFFEGLVAGTYTVTEVQPAGYTDGTDTPGLFATAAGNDAVTVVLPDGGASTGNLFAETVSGSISGVSFVDLDDDGVQDAGEPGLAGVRIDLTGTDSVGRALAFTTFTGADGSYSFTGLRPAAYALTQTQPTGYVDGEEAAGTAGGTVSGPDAVTGILLSGADQQATGYTFGDLPAAVVSGVVRADTGGPIAGVTVTLSGTDDRGNPVSVDVVTAADGSFVINGLRPGTYQLVETQPAGYGPGSVVVGPSGGTASQPDTITGIVLVPGQQHTGHVFVDDTASVAGSVYEDLDGDGVRDAGEPGLPGVQVVVSGTDANGDAVSGLATTDASGAYLVDGLLAGTYTVLQPTQPAGYLDGREAAGTAGGTPNPPDQVTGVTLTQGQDATGYTFGEVRPASLAGAVTADGVGVPGVTITLTGTDDLGRPVSTTVLTGSDGSWSFPGLRPGTYTVTETQPAGYGDGPDTAGTAGGTAGNDVVSGIVLSSGTAATGYAFTETAGSVAGSVYVDADADGVRDAGEVGLGGVTVALTGTTDGGASLSLTTTTESDGSWSFAGVPGGTYTVTETQPAGYLDGREAVGSAGGSAGPGSDEITVLTLEPSEDATGYTFGEVLSSGIAGSVVDDQGDPIQGVTITLTGTDDVGNPVSLTTTTDADGAYDFTDIRPGTYTVTETQPAGYAPGTVTAGTAGGDAAPPNQVTGIVITPGTTATGYDFVDATGSLAGSVYVDADGDGTRDPGEPGIAGVEVVLTGTDGAADGLTVTVTTGADGSWTAVGLVGGTWSIAETQPVLWADGDETVGTVGGTADGDDTIEGVVLPDGGSGTGYLFGEAGASLAGTVYTDADGDGTRDAGEPGIAGVTITVTGTDADGAAVAPRTTTTGADGSWSVPGLPAGTYVVTETQPAGYADGAETVGSAGGTATGPDSVTGVDLAAGEVAEDYDFGERLGVVTGVVWYDVDRDGVLDVGETGIQGVTVTLLDADGDVVASTTTGADGSYEFTDLAPGDYTVVETQPAGYGSSTPNSVAVTVDGSTGADASFGDTLGTIGDRVWSDTDRDGVQGAGEPGVGGITVQLLDADGGVVATTVTAADGGYLFAVPAGTYQVLLVLPAGTTVTQPGAGSDRGADSDVVQATLTTAPVTLGVGADGSAQDVVDVDAGLVPVVRDLTVSIAPDRGTVTVGDEIVWTVVVTNEGSVPEDGAVVVVTLPPGVVLQDTVGDGWTCTASGQVLTCSTDAVIPPGGQVPPLQVLTTVTAPGDPTVTVTVQPTDGSTDAVPANDEDGASVEVARAVVPPTTPPPGTSPPGTPPPGGSPDDRLPRTGAELAPWLGTATLLMAMGTALVLGVRRRRDLPVGVPQED